MTREPFDVKKIRKNWERASDAPEYERSPRFASVRAPLDPYAEGRALLSRIQSIALTKFANRTDAIQPFFTQAAILLTRMERRGQGVHPADPTEAEQGDSARDDFQQVLRDMEDLFEVFAGIGR